MVSTVEGYVQDRAELQAALSKVNAVVTDEVADVVCKIFDENLNNEIKVRNALSLHLFKKQCLDNILMNEKVPNELEKDIKLIMDTTILPPTQSLPLERIIKKAFSKQVNLSGHPALMKRGRIMYNMNYLLSEAKDFPTSIGHYQEFLNIMLTMTLLKFLKTGKKLPVVLEPIQKLVVVKNLD